MTELRKLQLAELELLRIFTDICKKEKLTYYMVCGTMLGAVRHKGFIPWDDDTDVAMPRPDYERFLQVVEKHLPAGYGLRIYKTDAEYTSYFAELTTQKFQVNMLFNSAERRDAWLDVFPLDGVPDGKIRRKIYIGRLNFLRRLYQISRYDKNVNFEMRSKGRAWYERLGMICCQHLPLQKLFSTEKRLDAIDRALKPCPYESAARVANYLTVHGWKEMHDKEVFGEGMLYQFEDMLLYGPSKYDQYLTELYGDYMVPLPEADRIGHVGEITGGIAERGGGYIKTE